MLQKWIHAFARYPWLSAACIVFMTILSLIGYFDPYLLIGRPVESAESETSGPTVSEANKERRTETRRQAAAAGRVSLFSGDAVMVVTTDDFFQPSKAEALRKVVESLEKLPQVREIMWMDTAPPLNLFGMLQPALPDHRASPARFEAAREAALRNPMIGGQLLSRDGTTTLLLIQLDWFHVRTNEDCTRELERVAREASASVDGVEIDFAVTGELPMQLLFKRNTLDNDRKFQWIAYGTVLLLATLIFRGPTAVFITALAPVLGIFWTLGCLRFFDLQDNPFNTVVVPVLLSMVGFTDGVHMMTHIRKYRAEGMTGRQAADRATKEVGLACFLTSLTTAIGFGSLGWAHHELVREFGWCCVLGVGITFLAVIAAIPLACSTWLGRSVHHGISKGLIESNVNRLSGFMLSVLRYPKRFAWGGILITMVCILLTLQLRPDERTWNAIPERSIEARALRHMDRVFGGLETAVVRIQWDDTIASGAKETIRINQQVEEILRGEDLLGSPLGIASLLEALPGEGDVVEKAAMVELLPPPLKRAFLRSEERESSVVFRVQDIGIQQYGQVFRRVADQLSQLETEHPHYSLKLSGSAIWRWEHLYQIVLDLIYSLGSAGLIIAISLAIAYRSITLGLIAIVPNAFPLAVTGAAMYLLGSRLELVSVLAFTVCLGIAVDDTIHFLTRYTEERKAGGEKMDAIYRAFFGVGSACIMTTLVLVCGFATVFTSDSRDHHIFALMGGSTIAWALLGDMLILPAMLAIFDRSKGLQ